VILQRLADAGLVKGKTIGIDATTLEANVIWTMYRPSTWLGDLLVHRENRPPVFSDETVFATGC
jgi:hypothetical protein